MSTDKQVNGGGPAWCHPNTYSRDFGSFDVTLCRGYDNSQVILVIMNDQYILNGKLIKFDDPGVVSVNSQRNPQLQSYYTSAMQTKNNRKTVDHDSTHVKNSYVKNLVSARTLARKMKTLLDQSNTLAKSRNVNKVDVTKLDHNVKDVLKSVYAKLKSTQNIMLINRKLYEEKEILKKTLKGFCEEAIRSTDSSLKGACEVDEIDKDQFHADQTNDKKVTAFNEEVKKIKPINSAPQPFWQMFYNTLKKDKRKRNQTLDIESTKIAAEVSDVIKSVRKNGVSSPDENRLMKLIDDTVRQEIAVMQQQILQSEEIVHELLDEIEKQEQRIRAKDLDLIEAREHIDIIFKKSKNDVDKLITDGEMKNKQFIKVERDRNRLQEDKSLMSFELERLRQTNRRLLNEVCCLRHSNRELEQLIEAGHDQRLHAETWQKNRGLQSLSSSYGAGHFAPGLYLRHQVTNASSPALVKTDNMMHSGQYNSSQFDNVKSSSDDEAPMT